MNITRPKRERKPTKFFGDFVDTNSTSKSKRHLPNTNNTKMLKKKDPKTTTATTTTTTTTTATATMSESSTEQISTINKQSEASRKTAMEKSVGTSKKNINNPQQALDQALIKLHSSAVPESLPCREDQFEDIYKFVSSKLSEGQGGCMYISGVPGTGKTATIRQVKAKLCENEELPSFKFIEINGMELQEPRQFFYQFLWELDGIEESNNQAAEILTQRFTDPSIEKEFVVLLIEEVDRLKTTKQDVLYQVFDWPNHPDSKLIVLAVANSMDLPERFLQNRVSSRLGLTRLMFQPYSHEELVRIVTSRLNDLNGFDVFGPDTLELICRKVAAVSGDVRRVLDISRRAIEMAIQDKSNMVSMDHVDKTLKEIFCSLKMNRIKKCSPQERIFFQALLEHHRSSGAESFQFIDVYNTHVKICRHEEQYEPTTTELLQLATNLDKSKMIFLEDSLSHLYRKISLNVSPADLDLGLKL